MKYHRLFFIVTALPAFVAADELVHDPLVGSLSKDWSWRAEQAGAWRIDPQGLGMRSMPGNLWAGSKDVRGWLFRPLPAIGQGVSAEVTVKAEPQANYEQAGLIWHADDANYVKVMLERFEGKLVVNFVREEADQPKIVAMAPAEAGSVSIRLIVRGGTYEAQSRKADAKEWITIGICDPLPKPPVQVGLGTMQGAQEKERWVHFSNFKITQPAEAGAE
jgi:regulation of enolase protein 1 (concanavalin A-like superfamily)